jgi:hypothetical protein
MISLSARSNEEETLSACQMRCSNKYQEMKARISFIYYLAATSWLRRNISLNYDQPCFRMCTAHGGGAWGASKNRGVFEHLWLSFLCEGDISFLQRSHIERTVNSLPEDASYCSASATLRRIRNRSMQSIAVERLTRW